MAKRTTKEVFNAELVKDGLSKLWLIRNQDRVVICFIEKWNPRRGYTDPFKIFRAICGQGPVHTGEMVAVDYNAKTPIEATQRNHTAL